MSIGGPQRLDPGTALAQALVVALQALDERAEIARWMLTDQVAYGIVDADLLHHRLRRDEDAGDVLRASLDLPRASKA